MTKFRKIAATLLLLSTFSVCFADSTTVRISGIFPAIPDQIANLVVYPEFYFLGIDAYSGIQLSDTSHDGRFEFEIPDIKKRLYIRLRYFSEENKLYLPGLFLAEPGDDVTIELKDGTVKFSGHGSKKYECQYLLHQIKPQLNDSIRADILARGGALNAFDSLMMAVAATLREEAHRAQLELLETYRSELPAQTYEQLYVDYLFATPGEQAHNYNVAVNFANSFEILARICAQANRSVIPKMGLAAGIDAKTLMLSRSFTDFAIQTTRLSLLPTPQTTDPTQRLGRLKSELRRNFQGPIYEHLLTAALTWYFRPDVAPELVSEIKQINFTNPSHQRLVDQIFAAKGLGQIAFPFELPDPRGDTVRLADFKEKVLVIEFWYTGCGPCIELEKRMKPIKELLRDDDRIVFISVNLDADRARWLTSLETDLYTDHLAINLFTGGLRFKHPLPKYHGLVSAPSQLIFNRKHQLIDIRPSNSELADPARYAQYLQGLAD